MKLPTLNKDKLTFLYHGSGGDILHPLFYADLLDAKEFVMHFVDVDLLTGSILKTLFDLKITCSYDQEHEIIQFAHKGKQFTVHFHQADALEWPIQKCDVYLERGFQLFREHHGEYVQNLLKNVKGLVISDWEFKHLELELIEHIKNTHLGFYQQIFVYRAP